MKIQTMIEVDVPSGFLCKTCSITCTRFVKKKFGKLYCELFRKGLGENADKIPVKCHECATLDSLKERTVKK